jgi:tetratricopeptide (TPR) repeat protein
VSECDIAITCLFQGVVNSRIKSSADAAASAVLVGAAALLLFMQHEHTGPPMADLPACVAVLDRLNVDGESMLAPAHGALLHAALVIFRQLHLLGKKQHSLQSVSWWYARALFVQQQLMSGPCATLCSTIDDCLSAAHVEFGLFDHAGVERLLSMSQLSASNHQQRGDNSSSTNTTSVLSETTAAARDDNALIAFIDSVGVAAPNTAVSGDDVSLETAVERLTLATDETDETRRELAARLYLERAHVLHFYRHERRMRAAVLMAQRAARVRVALSGEIGRRTKFQSFDLAQLTVVVDTPDVDARLAQSNAAPTPGNTTTPKAIVLDDDTRLDAVEFKADAATRRTPPLRPLERAIVLACGVVAARRGAHHDGGIGVEEQRAYVDRALAPGAPSDWTVHTGALLARAHVDARSHRTMERGALQVQALVDQFALQSNADDASAASESVRRDAQARTAAARLRNAFAVNAPARRTLRLALGDAMLSIGAARTAQSEFEALGEHTRVLRCLRIAGDVAHAERVCREQLTRAPSPALWLALGELLLPSDTSAARAAFESAWSLSAQHHSAAQRALAGMAMRERRWADAVTHWEAALAINALHADAWFSCGCALMQLERFGEAVGAFRSAVQQAPDDAESWANLGAALLRGKRARAALHAMRVAVRHAPRNWRMWQNVQYVALDVDELQMVVLAVRTLVELDADGSSARHELQRGVDAVIDTRVLGALAGRAVAHYERAAGAADESERALATVLLSGTLDLLKYASTQLSSSDELWTIVALTHQRVARLSTLSRAARRAHHTRTVDARLRAQRCAELVSPEWASAPSEFAHVAAAALAVADAYFALAQFDATRGTADDSSASAPPTGGTPTTTRNDSSITSPDAISVPPMSASRLKMSTLLKKATPSLPSTQPELLELAQCVDKLRDAEAAHRT